MSKLISASAHHARHEPAGSDEVNDIDIGNTGVLLSAHKARHVAAGADQFIAGDLLNATAKVNVSKNSGATVGTRRRINYIEGANITLTVADDAVNEEVDVTIAAAGGVSGDLSQYFPASDPNSRIGTHPSMEMLDGVETTIYQSFMIPKDITTITQASILVVSVASGDIRWDALTNFGKICAAEDYNTHTDSAGATTSASVLNKITCLNITAALTDATAKDLVGVQFVRYGAHAWDTITASVHFLGIYLEGT